MHQTGKMRSVIVISALAALCLWASVASGMPQVRKAQWEEYKLRYNKVYPSKAEDNLRRAIFEQHLMELGQLGAEGDQVETSSFRRGINLFSDLTHDEYRSLNKLRAATGKRSLSKAQADKMLSELTDSVEVPESVDWRLEGRVGPVKYQGACGSCWAFATVGLLEGQELKNRSSRAGKVMQLSEQNLVDCSHQNGGCLGGNLDLAVDFVAQERGLDTETDYPYQSGNGADGFPCRFNRSSSFASTRSIQGSYILPKGDEDLLKKFVAKYGPVAVGIDASHQSFKEYKSGIYQEEECSISLIDHAVLIVGYGVDKVHGDYWLVKNSWSEMWGERGYFKLARNRDNHCGVASMATIAK